MSNSKPSSRSNVGFWLAAGLITVSAAGLAASAWPLVMATAHTQSDRLFEAGKTAQGSEAQLNFDLAVRLNPSNQPAALELARTQIAAGQSQQATRTLGRAGEGTEALRLRLKSQLELGRLNDAAASANKLATTVSTTNDDLVLAALTNILNANSERNQNLVGRITAPEAAGRVAAAQSDKITLARELYASGLLESSKRLLVKQPPSYERDYLLANIDYTQPTSDNLTSAEKHATTAVALNPVSQPARQLLIRILNASDKTEAAAKQQRLLAQLKSGRP